MANHVGIEETTQIPGYPLYEAMGLEKEFRLRAMTTLEEKIRLSAPGFSTMARVIQNCLVNNKEFDVRDLKIFDFEYLMYKLRIVTYGAGYPVTITCPYCKRQFDHKVNLSELEVNEVPSDFKEPFKIGPLPVSKDVLECRILTAKDYIELPDECAEFLKHYPAYEGDPEFILDLCRRVVSVNGKELPNLRTYIETLHARDYQYFSNEYLDKTNSYGINTVIEVECPHCKKKHYSKLPFTSEFFRPSYCD